MERAFEAPLSINLFPITCLELAMPSKTSCGCSQLFPRIRALQIQPPRIAHSKPSVYITWYTPKMKSAHSLLGLTAWTCAQSLVLALYLNITAIGAQNGASTLECWEMETPFSTSTTPGTNGSASVILGNVTSLSYTITPPGLDGGWHNAAHNQ